MNKFSFLRLNLPNSITLSRVVLTPLICFFLLSNLKFKFLLSALLFFLAMISDYFDGKVARRKNTITSFGKIFDPVADKILIFSLLICFLSLKLINPWIIILLISRDFLLMMIRMFLFKKELILHSSKKSKLKTFCQCMYVFGKLSVNSAKELYFDDKQIFIYFELIFDVILWVSIIFSIFSLFEYIKNNKNHIREIIVE